MLSCLNTKGKYGKVRDMDYQQAVTIIIFVEFIDRLIEPALILVLKLRKSTAVWVANTVDLI